MDRPGDGDWPELGLLVLALSAVLFVWGVWKLAEWAWP